MPGTSWERAIEQEKAATGAPRRAREADALAPAARAPRPGASRRPHPRKVSGARVPGTGRAAAPAATRRGGVGVVVVDSLPLFRAGAVAALVTGGLRVVGEVAHLAEGIQLARSGRAGAVLLGGASVEEAKEAVASLPACAVVVLLAQPSRAELVDMLGAGVAGLGPRSLTAEELVGTVEAAAEAVAQPGRGSGAEVPVFVPLPIGLTPAEASEPPGGGPEEPQLTPKEREILAQLAQGASNKRIAEALFVTPATVKTHLAHIYAKLGARGRHEALTHALSMGLMR